MADTLDMTDLEIARECGATGPMSWPAPGLFMFDEATITAFADRIRAQQREKDAQICETLDHGAFGNSSFLSGVEIGSRACASAIRSPAADAPTGDGKHA